MFPVMNIANDLGCPDPSQIFDAADAVISQRLSQLKGVGGVNVSGSALPPVRVEINPLSLSKYGIGLQDIRAAISNSNANAPKGAIPNRTSCITRSTTNDNAREAEPYRNLIIREPQWRHRATRRHRHRYGYAGTAPTENIRTYGLYKWQTRGVSAGVSAARAPTSSRSSDESQSRAAVAQGFIDRRSIWWSRSIAR